MKITKHINYIVLVLICLSICACSTTKSNPANLYKDKTEVQIFKDGQHAMKDGSYDVAIKHFETLDARYPFGKYARQAQLDSIYSYYKKEDVAEALAAADRYIRLYPRGPDVDYAYYLRGLVKSGENRTVFDSSFFSVDLAKRDLATLTGAYADFKLLIHYYPRSKYAPDARKQMVKIWNALGRHQLQVGQFYFNHEAYVAAINRSDVVIKSYKKTPSVPKALAIMVKSYRKLHLPRDATAALSNLQKNFPNSKELRAVT
jgi:outer membrane protein assembly factor BamD